MGGSASSSSSGAACSGGRSASATSCQPRSGARGSVPAAVGVPRGCARSATNVPRPGRGTTSPSPASRASARCTVTGDARWRAISSRTDGRRLPGGRARAAVRTSSITRDSVLPSIMSTESNVTTSAAVTQDRLQRGRLGAYVHERHAALPPGLVLGALGVLGFSFSLPATRLAVADLDPVLVAFGRAVVAGLLSIAVLSATHAPRPSAAEVRSLAVVALGVIVGFPLFTSLALHRLPAAHGAVVVGMLPAVTAVTAVLRAGERPTRAFWLASGAGLVAVLTFALTQGGGGLGLPDLELLAAVALCALGYAEGGRLSRELGGARTICWALVLALPVTVPVA